MTDVWVLRAYVPTADGRQADCDCTPDPVGGDVGVFSVSRAVRGWLHQAACPITDRALQDVTETGVA